MVLEAGYTFYVTVKDGAGSERIGVLEQGEGVYTYRMIEGSAGQAESAGIRDRMAEFNRE